jgi:hypothetical protein
MEHAKITLITTHEATIKRIRLVITGDLINTATNTPLRLVTTAVILMEIDKITIDPVSALLEVVIDPGLANSNPTCAE